MAHKKYIAALLSLAIVFVFWTGCELTVNEAIRNVPIFEPYISVQPNSYVYNVSEYEGPPTLEIEIVEWDSKEGELSFKWYTFSTMKNFFENNPDAIPGATGKTYKPSITAVEGKSFFYYVEVTNTNPDAIGAKSSAIRSDVAVISFNTAGKPATPLITQNPTDASYIMGRQAAIAALEVRATATSGTLTYQWYKLPLNESGEFPAGSFDADGNPAGIAISGATQRTYLPDLDALSSGRNFYYVKVINATVTPEGVVTASTERISTPAVITMEKGERAAAPRIDTQPRDILYINTPSEPSMTLSVAAVSPDRGQLSYQWYSSTAPNGANPTMVGAGPTFAPPKEEKYYYVVVTNTNENVVLEENQKAELKSKVVSVKVQNPATITSGNAVITVDTSKKQQYIRGYGGMETTWGNFFQSEAEEVEAMFDPDVLGYNIWRIMIPPINTDIEAGMAEITQRSYANRYYDNVKIVNKHGGYVLASPWSPPKEWKSNNSINSGGHLIYGYRKQFANYLRSYARHMASKGAPIYAVSIANEPNYAGGYDGCEWTPEEMRDFFIEVGRFTQGVRGFGGGKVIPTVLTVNGESANNPNINSAALNNPVSNAAIDLFARHVYGNQTERLWGNPNLKGRDVWMTEHNINSASDAGYPMDSTWNYMWRFMNDVDLVIRLNNENAFVWWVVKRFYSFIGEGAASTLVSTPGNVSILPRGWGMAHYSKFSIDSTRIPVNVTGTITNASGATVPVNFSANPDIAVDDKTSNVNNNKFDLDNTSVRITAFISQDGSELSLVMWTPTMPGGDGGYSLGNAEIRMPDNFTIRSVTAMRSRPGPGGGTSRSVENMGKLDNSVQIASNRRSAFVNLPRSEMLSVKFIKDND